MQKARRHCLNSSDRLLAHGFRYYFTPLKGVLFTFPSRYWYTIGLLGVFSLAGWSRRIQTRFLVPRPTQVLLFFNNKHMYRTFTSFGITFQIISTYCYRRSIVALQPHKCRNKYGLGLSPFDRLYLGNHFCFPFLRVLRCFSSPGLLLDNSR